eukprot:g69759.t1
MRLSQDYNIYHAAAALRKSIKLSAVDWYCGKPVTASQATDGALPHLSLRHHLTVFKIFLRKLFTIIISEATTEEND